MMNDEIDQIIAQGRKMQRDHKDRQQGIVPLTDLRVMAKAIAASKMFGITNEDQAMTLMLMCQAEGLHPIMALRRYHIIDGRPAFRADALQGEFEKDGAIVWHVRTEKECAATFFRDGKYGAERIKRAAERYKKLKAGEDASALAYPGEITVIRTIEDAIEKRVAMRWDGQKWVMKHNWQQSPRQMLHARCLTEGVRAINPGLIAGVYTEDEIIDIPPDEDRVPVEVIERNVRQATENAQGEFAPGTLVDVFHKEQVSDEVTADNYKDVISHVGKAEGEVLGKRVGDLHRNVVEWLHNKWRNTLGPSASEADFRLKKAVEFAYNAPKEETATLTPPKDKNAVPAQETTARAIPERKSDLIRLLQDRISDLCITEAQACGYLRIGGFFTKEQTLADADIFHLEALARPGVWQTLVDLVEKDLKPKPAPPKAAKKTGRR